MRTATLTLCLTAVVLALLARNQELAVRIRVDLPTASTNHFTLDLTPILKRK